jgi:hypothetical protein
MVSPRERDTFLGTRESTPLFHVIPRCTLPVPYVASPYRDPPPGPMAILQRYDATAYKYLTVRSQLPCQKICALTVCSQEGKYPRTPEFFARELVKRLNIALWHSD